MTDRLPPTAEGIARAAELLAGGAVVAFPTDTVYGVGVAALAAGSAGGALRAQTAAG